MVTVLGSYWRRLATERFGLLVIPLLGLLLTSHASAQTSYYWAGQGSNTNWTTTGNFKSAATGTTNSVPADSQNTILLSVTKQRDIDVY